MMGSFASADTLAGKITFRLRPEGTSEFWPGHEGDTNTGLRTVLVERSINQAREVIEVVLHCRSDPRGCNALKRVDALVAPVRSVDRPSVWAVGLGRFEAEVADPGITSVEVSASSWYEVTIVVRRLSEGQAKEPVGRPVRHSHDRSIVQLYGNRSGWE